MSATEQRVEARARRAVAREIVRAVAGAAGAPLDLLHHFLVNDVLRAHGREDLAAFAPPVEAPAVPPLPFRPLRIFVSAAEASGEMHAESLVRALRALARDAGAPEPEIRAFGGGRLRALSVETLGDPVARAAMGLSGHSKSLPYYAGLLEVLARELERFRPDVFVPVDSPALHVPMAHIAQRAGVPVVHFVTPQYWAWAPWRVAGYRRAVDRALTILPFEPAWFARHGIDARHVGHPLLDVLPPRERRPERDIGRMLVLLPGSREGVAERNLPWMLGEARRLAERVGDLDVVVAQADERLLDRIRPHLAASPVPARIVVGELHATLASARAALSVSGTVLIDLLHQRLPAVVVYRLRHRRESWMARHLLTLPWFASPNLLAGREIYPEFCFRGEGSGAIGAALERCYNDALWRQECVRGLERAAARLGPPGASERAARHALEVAVLGRVDRADTPRP